MAELPVFWLGLVFLLANMVEAVMGFGSTLTALSLGSLFLTDPSIIPICFIPANLTLNLFVLVKDWKWIDLSILLQKVLPYMLFGFLFGWWFRNQISPKWFQIALGLLLIILSVVEWYKEIRQKSFVVSIPVLRLLTTGAGFTHGLFATGGPLLVYAATRYLSKRSSFRATLSAIWFFFNVLYVFSYQETYLRSGFLPQIGWILVMALPGIWIGNYLHHKISLFWFRRGVFTLILLAGLALIVRNA
ncbi:MAG: TSUP family transporter [Bacteroidia bacterium]|nr:TSUP family transporter [Bacteroidia bacterium]